MPKIVEIKSRVLELSVCCILRTRQSHRSLFVGLNVRATGTNSVPPPPPPILVLVSTNTRLISDRDRKSPEIFISVVKNFDDRVKRRICFISF